MERYEELKIKPLVYHKDTLVSYKNVSIYYDDKQICNDISFDIHQGERVFLNGINGSGKSSLIKLLWNQTIKYSGEIYVGSKLKISYVPQDTSFLKGNLKDYAAKCGIDESLFKSILRKFGFERIQFEKDIQDYSDGQKKKVLLAKSLSEQAHLYIWDEPLNYLDIYSRKQLETLIVHDQPTLLVVEHDKAFETMIATKVIDF